MELFVVIAVGLVQLHTRNIIRHPYVSFEKSMLLCSVKNAGGASRKNTPPAKETGLLLTSVSVEPLTIVTETIATITRLALPVGNIPAGRASAIVVVDTMLSGLLDFVH
jgi:hypothetical protein